MISGKHLIAGEWVAAENTFESSPATGRARKYSVGTRAHVDAAAVAAETAFSAYSNSSSAERARFLDRIAQEIEKRGEEITQIGSQETGLPEARLVNERGRTVGQLRLFARHIESGKHLDHRHDPGLPEREPLPRPELHLLQRPVGPVAVFGASNFPLAFSVAGGDTASALAAGCPVVVKGHSAHPGTSEIVAQAVDVARIACGLHPGVFSLVQGGKREVGRALVQHPLIKAVGFTGSLVGGRALFDLCVQRPEPIPFFGELGSVNPMFLLPSALSSRGPDIARGWAGSLSMGAGQFCTNPGLAIVVDSAEANLFIDEVKTALVEVEAQTMLTEGIADAYRRGTQRLVDSGLVEKVLTSSCEARNATPNLLMTSGREWLDNMELGEEVFGPLGLVVKVTNFEEMLTVARSLLGQLTCTLHLDPTDNPLAQQLLPVLERKAGRLLANGFPTGVEVCEAMVHGGPYPASTNFGATSVGTMAIRRFLRPVCYQDIPADLLSATV
jgi:2,5-dioxopentanoate dehydrogenase